MNAMKMIGYPIGAALLASLTVLVIALFVFGFQMSEGAEWEGRIVGVVGTVLGVAAAAFGFWRAQRTKPEVK